MSISRRCSWWTAALAVVCAAALVSCGVPAGVDEKTGLPEVPTTAELHAYKAYHHARYMETTAAQAGGDLPPVVDPPAMLVPWQPAPKSGGREPPHGGVRPLRPFRVLAAGIQASSEA